MRTMLGQENELDELGTDDPEFWFQALRSLVRGLVGALVFVFVGGLGASVILSQVQLFGVFRDESLAIQIFQGVLIGSTTVGFCVRAYTNQERIGHREKLLGLGLVVGGFFGTILADSPRIARLELIDSIPAGVMIGGLVGFAIGRVWVAREGGDDETWMIPVEQLPLWDREMDG